MANRAYLYADDRPDAWHWPLDGPYYDSRHTFPLAWFFLFRPEDLRLIDVSYDDARWREVRMSAEKGAALALFERRRPLLASVIDHRLGVGAVDQFVSKVSAWSGRHLLVEPSQVFQDDEEDARPVCRILEILDGPSCEPAAVREAARPYVGEFSPDPDRFECQVLGWTYPWAASAEAGPDDLEA